MARNKQGEGVVVKDARGAKPGEGVESPVGPRQNDNPGLPPLAQTGDGTVVFDVRGRKPRTHQIVQPGGKVATPENPAGDNKRGNPPPPPPKYRVVGRHPRVNIGGLVTSLADGKIVSANTHNMKSLIDQGVKLEKVEPSAPEAEVDEEEADSEPPRKLLEKRPEETKPVAP